MIDANIAVENYIKTEGIVHQKTDPYTPEQNGLRERFRL